MKPLTCEMCGSTNLLKQDGVFVCQSCGTKYSVEEAKKMMVEGTVAVEGTVKIDTSSELKNLYEIARRAKDMENAENAEKYYDMILIKDPMSWEANFYVVYYRAMKCKIAEIGSAASSLINVIEPTVQLIAENISNDEERQKALAEIHSKLDDIATMLFDAATSHYNSIDEQIRGNYNQEYGYNVSQATLINYTLGDTLENKFGDTYASMCYLSWFEGVSKHCQFVKFCVDKESNKQIIYSYSDKMRKIDPNYQTPEIHESNGCYVATAVYGSYDCPEVWTLRRFRDFTLAEAWYGRAFIHTYYAISPTIVKWFGSSHWFKTLWHKPLDKLVKRLKAQGVESTPYQDKKF